MGNKSYRGGEDARGWGICLLGGKAVADAAFSDNVGWRAGVKFNLLAHMSNVDAQRIFENILMGPQTPQDEFSADGMPRVPHQDIKQLAFGGSEFDVRAVHAGALIGEIN